MKIAWCHNGVTGGAKRATHALVSELVRRGHAIDEYVVAEQPVRDYLPLEPMVNESHETVLGLPRSTSLRPYVVKTNVDFLFRAAHARRAEALLKDTATRINAGGYDVAHIDHHPCCDAVGLLPYLDVPAVVYCHEAAADRYEFLRPRPAAGGSTLRRLYAGLCDLPRQRFDALRSRADVSRVGVGGWVLTNSRYSSEVFARRYGIEPQVCYLGVDIERFRPLRLSPAERPVLSVGRLVEAKRHHVAIEAAARLPEAARPVVVIATPEKPRASKTLERLTRLAESCGVTLRVVHEPSQRQLVEAYNEALAVVFVPRQEPFGLVALEAMACGTPVIGVTEGGVAEIIEHERTGLLTDGGAEQVAEAIRRLITVPALRERLSRQALEAVRRDWTWQAAADRYEEVVVDRLGRRFAEAAA